MCCAFVAIYRYNRDVRMTKNKVFQFNWTFVNYVGG